MPNIIHIRRVVLPSAARSSSTASSGTARQAPSYFSVVGMMDVNSGATVRQTGLPGADVTEGV